MGNDHTKLDEDNSSTKTNEILESLGQTMQEHIPKIKTSLASVASECSAMRAKIGDCLATASTCGEKANIYQAWLKEVYMDEVGMDILFIERTLQQMKTKLEGLAEQHGTAVREALEELTRREEQILQSDNSQALGE